MNKYKIIYLASENTALETIADGYTSYMKASQHYQRHIKEFRNSAYIRILAVIESERFVTFLLDGDRAEEGKTENHIVTFMIVGYED